jgi:hypothetical protein
LSAYYNTGSTLSRTRSGKKYGDDDDIEESDEESGSDIDEIQDVAQHWLWIGSWNQSWIVAFWRKSSLD